jgi:hypothetical protein
LSTHTTLGQTRETILSGGQAGSSNEESVDGLHVDDGVEILMRVYYVLE